MKNADERVSLQAIEFWSTVCEEEVELAIEAQDVYYRWSFEKKECMLILF